MRFKGQNDTLDESQIVQDDAALKRIGETLRKRLAVIFKGDAFEIAESSAPFDKEF